MLLLYIYAVMHYNVMHCNIVSICLIANMSIRLNDFILGMARYHNFRFGTIPECTISDVYWYQTGSSGFAMCEIQNWAKLWYQTVWKIISTSILPVPYAADPYFIQYCQQFSNLDH